MSNITKDNFIVVYRLNDDDSKEVAEYYAEEHFMSISNGYGPVYDTNNPITWRVDGQLVGILCSDEEILAGEWDFDSEIIEPLRGAIYSDYSPLVNRTIWGVVLGYNVPGGFYHKIASQDPSDPSYISNPSSAIVLSDGIISSTSRVARGCAREDNSPSGSISYHEFGSGKTPNKFYQRSVFKRFDAEDAEFCLIASRIDAPTVALAKGYIDNASFLNEKLFIEGKFYIDPYSDKTGTAAENYKNDILNFYNGTLQNLNLDVFSTEFMDPYIDVVIPHALEDNFVWSWFTDRSDSTFFQSSDKSRVFFYNADYDGARTVRDIDENRWALLSLNAGYATTAGAMSNPGIDGFLQPDVFFTSLLNEATLGEAYLFSLPYLDWTMTLFGDPLARVSFPNQIVPSTLITEDASWCDMSKQLARVAAYLLQKENELYNILKEVVDSNDLTTELDLLNSANKLYINNSGTTRISDLVMLVNELYRYPVIRHIFWGIGIQYPNINDYLTYSGCKISQLLVDVNGEEVIDSSNILDEGWWEFVFVLSDDTFNYVNYHFILEVYSSEDMGHENLVLSKDSGNSVVNWYYEKEANNYVQIPIGGVPASYVGRNIEYISMESEYLTRANTYYFKIIQYNNEGGTIYSTRNSNDIIYS